MKLISDDIEQITKVLTNIDFLPHLSPDDASRLLSGFEKTEMKKGEILINQGTSGSIFYIIASGVVGVFLKRSILDKRVATLTAGEFFGEMSLISDKPRSASVICEADGEVYTMLKTTFQDVIMHNGRLAQTIKDIAAKRRK